MIVCDDLQSIDQEMARGNPGNTLEIHRRFQQALEESVPIDTSEHHIREQARQLAGFFSECALALRRCCSLTAKPSLAQLDRFSMAEECLRDQIVAVAKRYGATGWRGVPSKVIVEKGSKPSTWRRILRRLYSIRLESASVAVGLVGRNDNQTLHLSPYSRQRHRQRLTDCAAWMSRMLVGVAGGEYSTSLLDVFRRSVGSPDHRGAEIRLRAKAQAILAREDGFLSWLLTLQAAGWFHPTRTVWKIGKDGARVARTVPNQAYTGSAGREAHWFIRDTFKRFRDRMSTMGFEVSFFRNAEPTGDGTPHWHIALYTRLAGDPQDAVQHQRLISECLAKSFGDGDSRNCGPGDRESGQERLYHLIPHDAPWLYTGKQLWEPSSVQRTESCHISSQLLASVAQSWASTLGIRQYGFGGMDGAMRIGNWRRFRKLRPLASSAIDTEDPEFDLIKPTSSHLWHLYHLATGASQDQPADRRPSTGPEHFVAFVRAGGNKVVYGYPSRNSEDDLRPTNRCKPHVLIWPPNTDGIRGLGDEGDCFIPNMGQHVNVADLNEVIKFKSAYAIARAGEDDQDTTPRTLLLGISRSRDQDRQLEACVQAEEHGQAP